jgi:cell wall-associated NlpC family hydrolase
MRRICAVAIGMALMLAGMPALAQADAWQGTRQQAINYVISRALSQRGVPFAYGGGNVSGPSLGTVSTPSEPSAPSAVVDQAAGTTGMPGMPGLNPVPVPVPAAVPEPAPAPVATAVGFDASGLIVYAFAGVGIKMPRSSGEQYKVGRKVLPSQALPGDLIFYGPDGTQSVALFIGNGQMVETTDTGVAVSPVRTNGMTPYLSRIIDA